MATVMIHYDARSIKMRKAIDNLHNVGIVVINSYPQKSVKASCYCGKPHIPNAKTLAAMKELDTGGGKKFESVDALFEDLYN
jgi:hypothetical protein